MIFSLTFAYGQPKDQRLRFDFYEGFFNAAADSSLWVDAPQTLTSKDVKVFYSQLNLSTYQSLIDSLKAFQQRYELSDWLYYQLIRKTAQQISPKENNYARYTLYKWFLLTKSGYDARLALTSTKVIFYVLNDEDVEDIPFFMDGDKKYICLNYHDYPNTNLNQDPPIPFNINIPGASKAFSYKITRMPDFSPAGYIDKELQFTYHHKVYYFNIKLNKDVETIFANYPVVDFESYFNIPMSKETYSSLIPLLKKNVKNMDQKKGVDYLMRFTRYAFLYETDEENFGKEKRLSPEETLFAKYSDCDDRAALFFYLVKEIYDLPMIAVLYPTHITMAVQFDKPIGTSVTYRGRVYSFCEPTPQAENLGIGSISKKLADKPYEVVYQYTPAGK
ncbi:hypothetical protein HYN43_026510 [Mucilaginibacter celer]|uniref:Transglutaminase domain-containing protein n=1 Tax=Mucilaginibacter celer TaxID=2305508 RepID=A0A494W7T3_9SPHI|nr:hypothetical protein HYN43_026510 [Mucilaginibacter celer]